MTVASIVALSAGCVALGWWLRDAAVNDCPFRRSRGLPGPFPPASDSIHLQPYLRTEGTSRSLHSAAERPVGLFVRPFSSLEAKTDPWHRRGEVPVLVTRWALTWIFRAG